MHYSFLIVEDINSFSDGILNLFENFRNYFCVGVANGKESAIEKICKLKPQLVIVNTNSTSLSFATILELHQYLDTIPYFIAIANNGDYALESIQSGVSDYLVMPLQLDQLGKSLFRFEKKNPFNPVSTLCIKSYSDYHFIALSDITYLKADNNTTDIFLSNGKVVPAFKTLKYFEETLPFYFLRLHKSYIVNINHVSRIHLSKSKCYLNYNVVLPFSINYKENIEAILRKINL
jgi:DNA-binding LytR/AlgR family response regulator